MVEEMEIVPADQEDMVKPRPYQEVMKDICVKQNTIIYLPTGAGKTFIAIMAIRHFAKALEKDLSEGGKRTVFVVNTVALARQQSDVLRQYLPFQVGLYSGEMNVDVWKRDRWREEFQKFQIIVSTCQIIVDVVNHGYLSVSDLNVLVLDECHSGTGDHPMHQLMSKFQNVPKHLQPRVIGLTGILLNNPSPQTVQDELNKLETVFQGTIATVENVEEFETVMTYSTDPVEEYIGYQPLDITPLMVKIESRVGQMIEVVKNYQLVQFRNVNMRNLKQDSPNKAKDVQTMMKDFVYQMKDLGIYGASVAILSVIVQLELSRLGCESMTEAKLYQSVITLAESLRHDLECCMAHEQSEYNKLMMFGSPKIKCLVQSLNNYVDESPENAAAMKALVFVQRRHSAKVVYHILKKVFLERFDDEPEPQIRPDFMVGRAAGAMPESVEQILADKNQRRVLDRFRKGETNLIVASSVLEEGIDVQSCNLVIRFDLPSHFRAYVQTKGRARMKNSRYLLMISKLEETTFIKKLSTYKEIEKVLKECLVGKTINRKPPLERDIAEELYNEMIPPFTTSSGATLTALNALQLLNRYAQLMPHDKFTNASVYWEKIQQSDKDICGVAVKLYLPIQSTIKHPIISDVMENVKLAKRHAAFKACKELYLNGELSENLLPIDGKKQMENIKELYFQHWDEEAFINDNPKLAGTKQNKRVHEMKCPEALYDCTPQPDVICYLYVINVEPLFAPTYTLNGIEDTTRHIFHGLIRNENNWAILTTKQLPKLPPMKLFLSHGEIRVTISSTPKQVMLANKEQAEKLRRFHVMTFTEILNFKKTFFACDRSGSDESYMVVPTKKGEIDFDIVGRFQGLSAPIEPPETWIRKMKFNAEDYLYKVIKPWYKLDETKYIVTAVHTDKTPHSPFPSTDYASFAEYVGEKYHKKVVHANQFMLETKGITQSTNLLHPGTAKDGASSRVAARFMMSEMYIPELVHNFCFPADLWLKAAMLPSILHRMRYTLLADCIRVALNTHLGLRDSGEALLIDVDKKVETDPRKLERELAMMEDDDDSTDSLSQLAVVSTISFPKVEETPAKEPTDLLSLCENLVPWKDVEEPIDIDRNWDTIHDFELDYYVQFISKNFEDMRIANYVESTSGNHLAQIGSPERVPLAIQDVPTDEKLRIKLLDVVPKAPELRDVLKAITTAGSMDVFDMERFEVLGDAFLKFSVSLYLIHRHDTWHEGFLTACKGKIVSNRNLFYLACKFQLPGVIKLFKFDPRNDEWVPPLLKVPRKIKDFMNDLNCSASDLYKLVLNSSEVENGYAATSTEIRFTADLQRRKNSGTHDQGARCLLGQQYVGDKIVADSMEALIGVYLHAAGIKKCLRLLSFFKILPDDDYLKNILQHRMESGMVRSRVAPQLVDEYLLNYKVLESTLGYTFRDRSYLLQALTHASYPTNNITGCYQELEFIGDAILDFLISSYIFQRCSSMDPGQLTDLRSALVNNNTLACLTVRNKIHLFILAQNSVLQETINKFVDYQQMHNHRVTDQVHLLISENDKLLADFVDVPKVLGDVFESLIGAIFFDSGNDIQTTWKVIYRLMQNEINEFIANVPKQLLRRLYEWPNAQPKFGPAEPFEDFVKINLRFTCKNEVLGVYGFGQNKEDAKRAAAKAALLRLDKTK